MLLLLLIYASITGLEADKTYHISRQQCKPVMMHSTPVRIPQCESRKIPIMQCAGVCKSRDYYPGQGSTVCTCCQPVKYRRVAHEFRCLDIDNISKLATHYIKEAVRCACKPCRKLK